MGLLYVRAGRLNTKNAGFGPGQMVGTHRGDPYDRSQRILVFVNAILISVVVSVGYHPIVTFEKQVLDMIGNLV
jgi:hypothetical protein